MKPPVGSEAAVVWAWAELISTWVS